MKWNEIVRIDIIGTRITAKDAMIMLDQDVGSPEWPTVTVSPGEYIVEIHLPQDWYCTRFRIRPVNSNPQVGRPAGTVAVDNGKAAFIDYDNFLAAIGDDYDAYEEWTGMELDDELSMNFSGHINFMDSPLVYVKSADGDGSYAVFELTEDGETVGLECRFD
ncbi:MAG: hypothetical protein ACR2QR_07525 [Woeseiaceae bacterium]